MAIDVTGVEDLEQEEVVNESAYFPSQEGDVPFWDHPLMYGHTKLPKNYYPYTTKAEVLRAFKRKQITEEDFTILKVLGDAVAANEDQLRRYLSSKMSRSAVSKRLEGLRNHGFVERWHCRLENDDEEKVRPPAPFTLGIAGYKLMKHFYSDCAFMNPDSWDKDNGKSIQRYVAMNELRCLLVESKVVRGWQWNATIGNQRKYRSPFGVAYIDTPNTPINFLIERPQMSQNFIGYLRDTLAQWKNIYENTGALEISRAPKNTAIVILYASTISMAEHIHMKLSLNEYPFQVWVCVEELLDKGGLAKSFMRPLTDGQLERIKLPFLEPKA
ncbi:hypothetical protein D5E69_23125 (plasmid) [Rossellomorea marisflavi]|uniref:MarR family transcriptional regulator n=1 Tax=Rossellomorea marisflavi TaxID=189381 RepID=UPI0013190BC7|nr:helix-turn-helix domain-containing protein [Rossellomorea marisflavi]QHA38727.1 hypothetical protein D5E69_23125 [Rossellomorea marisflavi]